ncbi:MAG: hypothetical protein ABMA15_27610, partial [Vicinamibacterales bacterium]
MRLCSAALGVAAVVASITATPARPSAQSADARRNWAQWRGPDAIGVSTTANPPLEWAENRNIKWKVEIPGRGHA